MIEDVRAEYARYRAIGERALAQLPDESLNRVPFPDGNSAAGQLVIRARMAAGASWRWISIPKGGSEAYNAASTLERAPR